MSFGGSEYSNFKRNWKLSGEKCDGLAMLEAFRYARTTRLSVKHREIRYWSQKRAHQRTSPPQLPPLFTASPTNQRRLSLIGRNDVSLGSCSSDAVNMRLILCRLEWSKILNAYIHRICSYRPKEASDACISEDARCQAHPVLLLLV